MQPGVTVVLATIWLALYANVVGTASLHPSRLTLDQYTPLATHHRQHGVYRRVEGQLDWKDQNPAENQPFDLSIVPRRSITTSATGSQEESFKGKYLEKDSMLRRSGNNAGDDFSPLVEDKQFSNSVGEGFAEEKSDGRGTKGQKSVSRELLPPSELENPPVADGTFQDQGPSSVEIYKLDPHQEKSPLSPTPITRIMSKSKSKTYKKTNHLYSKGKTTEYKVNSPKMFHKQSNSFDDFGTEILSNHDPFSIGGVPELQVGCEGLEASDQNKEKRSIASLVRDKNSKEAEPWVAVTPISLDLDYELSGEEGYEEMDELFKLKKLETTTKGLKQNRGDMEAILHSNFFDDKRRTDKLPVRGDLGKSSVNNESTVLPVTFDHGNQEAQEKATSGALHFDKGKQGLRSEAKSADSSATGTNQRRKMLWFDDSDVAVQPENERRRKRGIWGFAEDEGVVSSDELQTANSRRRQDYERRREEEEEERRRQEEAKRRQKEAQRRSYYQNRTNSDIEAIKDEYEKFLEQKQRQEEERQRRLQQMTQRSAPNRWQQEEEQRRRLEEDIARRNQWLNEERRRQELEASRRTVKPQTSFLQEAEEKQRRLRQEEERRRRQLEARRREWMLKIRQQEEAERKRQQQSRNEPSNLLNPTRAAPSASRPYDAETEKRVREQQERERLREVNEYIQSNQPINVNSPADRQREEANRRRQEEERKLQEYVRRNQPVRLPKENDRNWQEYIRRLDEARQYNRSSYPGPGNGRRNHGPSAPTNIDPRNYVDENRRREAARRIEEERISEQQRQQQEQLRREVLRREEEARKLQSRRYEEERKRLEATRLEEERRAKELLEEEARRSQAGRTRPLENIRPSYEDRRRFEEHRRRHDTSLIPGNLYLNESRRAMELQKQRLEQERRRLEAERRWQGNSGRAKEARLNEHNSRAMEEQRRRQEEARLNALPVSARIIVRPAVSSVPKVISRADFDTDIGFMGVNPNGPGIEVPNFPAPSTRRPPAQSPTPCVWAVIQCCPSRSTRLVTCFETMGCPGVNWDPNPCRGSITQAAREQLANFYAENEDERDR
ncbi:hypothetical protein WH47_02453 [Habropoda laboriosa]|uniref:Reticulocyte-binding protein 2 like protein a n=1 Tax=Habropoda laboriosa TaxID=597456 RepID=A0A0L7QWT9_9HYME|nr:PREDICTED: trichohyalin-like [Habropoda laboriosa]XP_017792558.1 PREDICTED: trichohyalin-like [Habropoda laboriosa]XP_017792559.1 PREDICTED: trichohyalin-like [Habropoda laboriosa]KOC63004.1 hypothetical protein WH47_02453 [Habropoda laboriosa]